MAKLKEKEIERHIKVLEAIKNAKTKEEIPNIQLSHITKYIATNCSFNGEKISQSECKPILDSIMGYGIEGSKEVLNTFIEVLRKKYPEKTDEEFIKRYKQIIETGKINNYLNEIYKRAEKIQELDGKEQLREHEENLKQIKNAYEIKDLPRVGIGLLNRRIQENTDNDFTKRISISRLQNLSKALFDGKKDEEIREEIIEICKEENLNEEDTRLMYEQIEFQVTSDKRIGYVIEEIKEKEKRILEIYKEEHEETMENIKNATRISQLPPNLTFSVLAGYLSGNTIIYPKANPISSVDFKHTTELLLSGKSFDSDEVKESLRKIIEKNYPENKEEAYELLKEKLSVLPKIQYMVEEINYSQERQKEFIGRNCSNVNVYFIENPNTPIEGGRFYNCYINRVQNLDLGELLPLDLDSIVPEGMDVDSVEWYVQQNYDKTFKTAGGIILSKDETIGNVNIFKPSDGKIGITKEEKSKYDELEELGKQVKSIIKNKNEKAEKFKELQAMYFEYQEETDRQLQELELKIDRILQEKKDISTDDKDERGER